jgi:predicted acyl esterase
MKKIVSQIKTINTDFADMAVSHVSKVTSPSSDSSKSLSTPASKRPAISEYEKQFIVDDLETGTVIRKAVVHMGLLLDDGVEFATHLNPLRKRSKTSKTGTGTLRQSHHEIRYRQKITIQAHDGAMLSANLFAPDTGDPGQTFPAIVFINSWCMDKHQYLLQARRFARKGYLVLSYSARGWGQSGGVVGVGGADDMRDVSSVIDWLIDNTPVQAENIGFSGISYGSGLSLLAAAHDKRIKTVVCMSGWADLFESFYSQETPRELFAKLLVSSSKVSAKTDDTLNYMLKGLLNNQHLDDVRAWAKERSANAYMRSYNTRKPPIYLIQNFQDELFSPNSVVEFYSRLKGPKRLDLNKGTHGSAELSGIIGLKNHLWMQTYAWFDHWLKAGPNQIMQGPSISCQFERRNRLHLSLGKHAGDRRSLEDWAGTTDTLRRYYLVPPPATGGPGMLGTSPSTIAGRDAIASSGGSSKSTAGIPLLTSSKAAHLNMPVKLDLSRVPEKVALLFQSEPLLQTMCILGTPALTLRIESSRPQVQLIAYLYEATEEGSARLITHGPMTRHLVTPNKPFKVSFEMITSCYEIPKGHRLALIIDTGDLQYKQPTRDDFEVTFHYDEKGVASLDVPMVAASGPAK